MQTWPVTLDLAVVWSGVHHPWPWPDCQVVQAPAQCFIGPHVALSGLEQPCQPTGCLNAQLVLRT
jgi:hypothetical protein